MKKIKLDQIQPENGQYKIYLGNGRTIFFPSKRKAQAFLNQTNKFLTQQTFEIHLLYMECWQEYQRCWFYFGSGDQQYSLHFINQQRCSDYLKSCEESLTLAISRSVWERGNSISFHCVNVAIKCLKDSVEILIPLFSKRSQTAETYRTSSVFSRLIDIENRLHLYGQFEQQNKIIITSKIKIAK